MKKLCFIGDSLVLQQAGVKRYNQMLWEWFDEECEAWDKKCILPEPSNDIDPRKTHLIKISNFPLSQRLRSFTSIPKYINKERFDLAIEPAHFGPFKLNKKVKRITVIHDLSPIIYPKFHPLYSSLLHRLFQKSILKKADIVITNSNSTKAEVLNFAKLEESKVLTLYPKIEKSLSTTQKLENILNSPYFIAIGTIEPRKNYLSLIKVFNKLSKDLPDCKLVIVGGDGWKNTSFYSTYKELNNPNIILTGFIPDLEKWGYLKHATGLISYSHHEGYGLPVLEAMDFNLPLILSDIKTYREIASNRAYLFKTEQQLITILTDLIKSPVRIDYEGWKSFLATERENQTKLLKEAIEKCCN